MRRVATLVLLSIVACTSTDGGGTATTLVLTNEPPPPDFDHPWVASVHPAQAAPGMAVTLVVSGPGSGRDVVTGVGFPLEAWTGTAFIETGWTLVTDFTGDMDPSLIAPGSVLALPDLGLATGEPRRLILPEGLDDGWYRIRTTVIVSGSDSPVSGGVVHVTQSRSVTCLEPPAAALDADDLTLSIEGPVEPGAVVELTNNGSGTVGAGLEWQCWNGGGWVPTHQVVRDFGSGDAVTMSVQPGVTTTLAGVGIDLPNSSPIVIPDVGPGTYRLAEVGSQAATTVTITG